MGRADCTGELEKVGSLIVVFECRRSRTSTFGGRIASTIFTRLVLFE